MKIHGIECTLTNKKLIAYINEFLDKVKSKHPKDYNRILKRVKCLKPYNGHIEERIGEFKSPSRIFHLIDKQSYQGKGVISFREYHKYEKELFNAVPHEFGHAVARWRDFKAHCKDSFDESTLFDVFSDLLGGEDPDFEYESISDEMTDVLTDVLIVGNIWAIEILADFYAKKWGIPRKYFSDTPYPYPYPMKTLLVIEHDDKKAAIYIDSNFKIVSNIISDRDFRTLKSKFPEIINLTIEEFVEIDW